MYYEDRRWMWERIEQLEDDLKALKYLSPYAAVHYIRHRIGYDGYVQEYAASRNLPKDELLGVLDELEESASNFKTVTAWEEHIAAYRQEIKENQKQKDADKSGVQILTLHAAKGTEYEAVFIPDINEGNIPFRKAVLTEDLEEERRMLYVGMTRAKSLLYLSAVKKRFDKKQEISSFLKPLGIKGEES